MAAYQKLGEKLYELEEDERYGGGIVEQVVKRIAREHPGIHAATVRCWLRVARGELPRSLMDTQVSHSTLSVMNIDVAQQIATGTQYLIASPTKKRLVKMSVAQMTRDEASAYVKPAGVLSVDEYKTQAPWKSLRAKYAEWSDSGKQLTLVCDHSNTKVTIQSDLIPERPKRAMKAPSKRGKKAE